MNNARLDLLYKYLKDDPNDPFNLYAIATEYKRVNPSKAIEYYEKLIRQHPDYLPTYYHLAETYISLEQEDEIPF